MFSGGEANLVGLGVIVVGMECTKPRDSDIKLVVISQLPVC